MIALERQMQKGQALMTAIIFLLALTFLGFGLVTISTIDLHSARNLRLSEQALSVAEEGALMGMAYASSPSSGFSGKAPGVPVTINSKDQAYYSGATESMYEVTLIKGSQKDCIGGGGGGGHSGGGGGTIKCYTIDVRATGFVREGGIIFDFAGNRPTIQRTVRVIADIKDTSGASF